MKVVSLVTRTHHVYCFNTLKKYLLSTCIISILLIQYALELYCSQYLTAVLMVFNQYSVLQISGSVCCQKNTLLFLLFFWERYSTQNWFFGARMRILGKFSTNWWFRRAFRLIFIPFFKYSISHVALLYI